VVVVLAPGVKVCVFEPSAAYNVQCLFYFSRFFFFCCGPTNVFKFSLSSFWFQVCDCSLYFGCCQIYIFTLLHQVSVLMFFVFLETWKPV